MKNIFNVKSVVFSRKAALFVLVAFITVLFVGLTMGMQHSTGDMPKNHCIFDMTDGCDMTLAEHMSFWQQFFTANVFSLKIEFVLFAGMSFVFVIAIFSRKLFESFKLWRLKPMIFYKRRNFVLSFFNVIFQLLPTGVLHPRVYQAADL